MKKILISLGVMSSLLQVVKAADLPILSDSPQPFSFAVLGDLHMTRPAFRFGRESRQKRRWHTLYGNGVAFVASTVKLGQSLGPIRLSFRNE